MMPLQTSFCELCFKEKVSFSCSKSLGLLSLLHLKLATTYITFHHHHQSVLPKGRSFTANSGTKAAILPKGRTSMVNSGTKVAVLLGMNRCDSFPLLSAPHSLFSIWTNLKNPRGTNVEVRREDLANWVLWTSPKFTTRFKYQFH